MRRIWPLQFLLALVGVGLVGLVWSTHYPEAPILERAASWPVVGPLAREIRRIYLPPAEEPPVPVPPDSGSPESGSTSSRTPAEAQPPSHPTDHAPARPEVSVEVLEAVPFEWFRAGTPVFEQPSSDSAVLLRLDHPARFGLFEERGDWARIRVGTRTAWIQVTPETISLEPPLGRAPAPVTAIPGRPPEPGRLEEARQLLEAPVAEGRLGPYSLLTDVRDEGLLSYLDGVAIHHGAGYRLRYGLRPVGEPVAAVVLFARERDYRRFQQSEAGLEGLRPAGHAGSGIVALSAGGARREIVASVLVHELTHMVNRRSIGPALPPWLEEGLANDLGGSRLDGQGRVLPGTVLESSMRSGTRLELSGFSASLSLLREASREGRLVPLRRFLEMDWERFVSSGHLPLHYAESGMLIRFLLAPEVGYGDRFRAFLRAVSRGEPATPEGLRGHLDSSWDSLEARFFGWLRIQLERWAVGHQGNGPGEDGVEEGKKGGGPPG